MCGIVGYTGLNAVAPILLQGLDKLEYRGYDSAGVGLIRGNSIEITRASGKLSNLAAKFENEGSEPGPAAVIPAGLHMVHRPQRMRIPIKIRLDESLSSITESLKIGKNSVRSSRLGNSLQTLIPRCWLTCLLLSSHTENPYFQQFGER